MDNAAEVIRLEQLKQEIDNIIKALAPATSLEAQPSNNAGSDRMNYKKYARDTQVKLLRFIANSKLDFSDSGNIPFSTVAAAKRIVDAQYKIPLDLPLPLLWPSNQTSNNISQTGSSNSFPDSDDSLLSGDQSDHDILVNALAHRLAVSTHPDLTYPPELFEIPLPTPQAAEGTTQSAAPLASPPYWAYGSFYRMEYPDSIAADDASENLEQMGLKLPQVVLDLGRLVATSAMRRPDGHTWSPSDFAVMVDMESRARTVWLVCDNNVVDDLRFHNESDGVADDLHMVRSLFDSSAMDLAVLFPRIDDWTDADNTWTALYDRISTTAMKLGLRLGHL